MYKFHLESLRRYRKRKEEVIQRDLYECDRELIQESEKLNFLKYKKFAAAKKHNNFKINAFKPSDTLLFEQYIMSLNQKIGDQNKKIKEKTDEKRGVTKKLLSAVKKRKMIEKLKEYRHNDYKKREAKKRQLESDESAVLRFRNIEDEG